MNELVKLCGAIATKEELLQLLDDHAAKVAALEAEKAELVEALEGMLADYCTGGCPDPDCDVCTASRTAKDTARAALAKAKGETPAPADDRSGQLYYGKIVTQGEIDRIQEP